LSFREFFAPQKGETMPALSRFAAIALLVAFGAAGATDLPSAPNSPISAIQWQPSFEAALQVAAQTGRPLFVHFWAPWCSPCMRIERDVFTQPAIHQVINSQFVPVKLNLDDHRLLAVRYHVSAIPTDVILSPQADLIATAPSASSLNMYVFQLNQMAATARSMLGAGTVQVSGQAPQVDRFGASGAFGAAPPPGPPQGYTPGTTPPPVQAHQPSYQPVQAAPDHGSPAARYSAPPSSPAVSHPPLGLDGYCPVRLCQQQDWVMGDRRFGAIHRGRTYLFAGPQEQQQFLANPDRFSPVASGHDPVIALDHRQAAPGFREHGVFYDGRVYLFSNEDSLQRFSQNPHRYAAEILQAMR